MTEPQKPGDSRPWLNTLLIILAVIVIGVGVCIFAVADFG